MPHTDAKQQRLHDLFAELRWIRQVLPPLMADPVELALHDDWKRGKIEKIEGQIEREMDDG
jgi:hypothetical protein